MAWARITENGKTTVLKIPDEKCNHGFDILIKFQEQSGIVPNDEEPWAQAMALRATHKAKDKKGIYA